MNLAGSIRLNKTGCCIIFCVFLVLFLYVLMPESKKNSRVSICLNHLLDVAIHAAENGGREVVANKDTPNISVKSLTKEGFPERVTAADFLSHCIMSNTLISAFPNLKLVSEEKVECDKNQIDFSKVINHNQELSKVFVDMEDVTVWIDPLDATYEFSEKQYEFVSTMVCIAVKGKPVIGVIHKPFLKNSPNTFWAWVDHAKSSNLKYKKNETHNMKIIVSISHKGKIEELLKQNLQNYELITAAGAGYKSLEVAMGHVDAYLHSTAIKKWDICAGNAIINAVGGQMTTKLNEEIDYHSNGEAVNDLGLIATIDHHMKFVGKI